MQVKERVKKRVKNDHWRWVALLCLLVAAAQAAEEADALPTLFDFLGAMVEQDGEWVDPLDMEQTFVELDGTGAIAAGAIPAQSENAEQVPDPVPDPVPDSVPDRGLGKDPDKTNELTIQVPQ